MARVRISPTVAADYRTRNVFPELRPRIGEPPSRYPIMYTVARALAQDVFDDAVQQAARCADHARRSLTLAYRSLARRTSYNFGADGWNWREGDASHIDPADFKRQAPVVDGFLTAVATRVAPR